MRASRSSGVLPISSISVERRSVVACSSIRMVMWLLACLELRADFVGAVLGNRGLQGAERQRRTARTAVHDLAAELVDHIAEVHLVDAGERFTFDHLGEDRGGGLADRDRK